MDYKHLATLAALVALSSALPFGFFPEQYISLFAPASAGQFNDLVLAVSRLYAGLLASVGIVLIYSRDSRISRARNALVLLIMAGAGVLFLVNLQLLVVGISGLAMLPLLLFMAGLFAAAVMRYRADFIALRELRANGFQEE